MWLCVYIALLEDQRLVGVVCSKNAVFNNKKAIRGGVPVIFREFISCIAGNVYIQIIRLHSFMLYKSHWVTFSWPLVTPLLPTAACFGPWECGPQHGFARTSMWTMAKEPHKASQQAWHVLGSTALQMMFGFAHPITHPGRKWRWCSCVWADRQRHHQGLVEAQVRGILKNQFVYKLFQLQGAPDGHCFFCQVQAHLHCHYERKFPSDGGCCTQLQRLVLQLT